MSSTKDSDFINIVISFIIIYFVWGATYLANAWGLHSFPPFLLAGIRFFIAGVLMVGYNVARGNFSMTLAQFKNLCLAGFLFFTIGNGFVVWGLQYVESGITALIIALQPLNVALMLWFMKGEKPDKTGWIGLIIGMVGMILLVGQADFMNDLNWLMGLGMIYIGIIAWAWVSIKISSFDMPKSLISSAGMQMLIGSIFLLIISFFKSEFSNFDYQAISQKSFYSMIFLITFGSIIAFTAFNYLLLKVSPFKVSTASYINPLVALYLGWLLNDEILSSRTIIASMFLLGAVVLINMGRQKKLSKS